MSRHRFPVNPEMLVADPGGRPRVADRGRCASRHAPCQDGRHPIKCLTAARRGARPSSASPHVVSPARRVGRAPERGSFLGHEQVWLSFEGKEPTPADVQRTNATFPARPTPARIGKMCSMILPTSVTPTIRWVRAGTSRSGRVAARRVCSRAAGSRFRCAARQAWTPSSRPARAAVFVSQQVDRPRCAVGLLWMSGLSFGSVDAWVRRHDESLWPQFPPRLASCCTSPQRSNPPHSSPPLSIPTDPCAGRCWQLLNHPAS